MQPFDFGTINPISTVLVVGAAGNHQNRFVTDLLRRTGGDDVVFDRTANPIDDGAIRELLIERRNRMHANDEPAVRTIVLNRLSGTDAYSMPSVRQMVNNARHYRLSLVLLEDDVGGFPAGLVGGIDWIVWFPTVDDNELARQTDLAYERYFLMADNLVHDARLVRNDGGAIVCYRLSRQLPVALYRYFPN